MKYEGLNEEFDVYADEDGPIATTDVALDFGELNTIITLATDALRRGGEVWQMRDYLNIADGARDALRKGRADAKGVLEDIKGKV